MLRCARDAPVVELSDWHTWWKTEGCRELHALLMLWWDPIAVKDAPQAQDEYSGYVGTLGRMLYEGATKRELAAFLGDTESGMGLEPNGELDAFVATKLLDWHGEAVRGR
jgi:hypothetical protein